MLEAFCARTWASNLESWDGYGKDIRPILHQRAFRRDCGFKIEKCFELFYGELDVPVTIKMIYLSQLGGGVIDSNRARNETDGSADVAGFAFKSEAIESS